MLNIFCSRRTLINKVKELESEIKNQDKQYETLQVRYSRKCREIEILKKEVQQLNKNISNYLETITDLRKKINTKKVKIYE